MIKKKILITGSLGFIDLPTVIELINAGFDPDIVDDLSNSELFIPDRIVTISGYKPSFYKIDLYDKADVQKLFTAQKKQHWYTST